jgi:hypothetical protein
MDTQRPVLRKAYLSDRIGDRLEEGEDQQRIAEKTKLSSWRAAV